MTSYYPIHDPDREGFWAIKASDTGETILKGLAAWDVRTLCNALNRARDRTDLEHDVTTAAQAWAEEDNAETRENLYQAISTLRAAHMQLHDAVLERWPGITRPIKRAA